MQQQYYDYQKSLHDTLPVAEDNFNEIINLLEYKTKYGPLHQQLDAKISVIQRNLNDDKVETPNQLCEYLN